MVLAMLQQKNLRLEAEMGRRAAVEAALKSTLDHLGNRRTDAVQVRERDGAAAAVSLPPIGICAATTIDGITDYFFNDKFLELSGLTSKQVQCDPGWVGAVHYQDRERVSNNIRMVDGNSRRLEYRFVLPDGSIRWVNGESISRETGYVHSAVDITQFRADAPQPPPPQPSRNGSIAQQQPPPQPARSGSIAQHTDDGWAVPAVPPTKRSIGYSRLESPAGPKFGLQNVSSWSFASWSDGN